MLDEYLSPQLAPPARVDRQSRVQRWPMYANDRLSDCTCAAAAHMVQSWTAYARGRETILPWRGVVAAYFELTRGDDGGAYCLEVLKHWRNAGIAGDRIAAFARLRTGDVRLAKIAIDLFGSCYLGFALPNFAVRTRQRWDVPPDGEVGDAKPNEANGHCVPAVGYDDAQVYIVTWGRLKRATWGFYRAYNDEAYAVLNRDWIERSQKSPSGFDFRALQRDLGRF